MRSLATVFASMGLAMGTNIATISNYFVDLYQEETSRFTIYYPYPMNLCVPTGAYNPQYATYECSDDGLSVTRTEYSDADCTMETDSRTFDSSNIGELGQHDFNCGGLDNYVTATVCLSSEQEPDDDGNYDCHDCLLQGVATWATDICHYAGNGTTTERARTECDNEGAFASYYPDAEIDCDDIAEVTLDAGLTCTYFGRIRTDWGRVYVYAMMNECVEDGISLHTPTTSPTEQPTEQPVENSGNNGGGGATGENNGSGVVDTGTTLIVIGCILVLCCIVTGGYYFLQKKKKSQVNYENRRDSGVGIIGGDQLQETGGPAHTNGRFDDISHDHPPRNTNDELIEAEASVDDVGLGTAAVSSGGEKLVGDNGGGEAAHALPENGSGQVTGGNDNNNNDYSDDSDDNVLNNGQVTSAGGPEEQGNAAVAEGGGIAMPEQTNVGSGEN